MSGERLPVTLAVRVLRAARVAFTSDSYGYEEQGGTSPFGTRRVMPAYLEHSILDLPRIYINGGKRGYLVAVVPQVLVELLKPELVEVAV